MFAVARHAIPRSASLERLLRIVVLTAAISLCMGAMVSAAVGYVSSLVTLLGVIALGVVVWGILVAASGVVDVRETVAVLQ